MLMMAAAGCDSTPPPAPFACAKADPAAAVDVGGRFRYASNYRDFWMRGTILLAQTGKMVEVTETVYDNADDRPLKGAAELQGNRLDVSLVPINGDTNYRAEVSFTFGAGGANWCLLMFSDTNGDTGGLASYYGFREMR